MKYKIVSPRVIQNQQNLRVEFRENVLIEVINVNIKTLKRNRLSFIHFGKWTKKIGGVVNSSI